MTSYLETISSGRVPCLEGTMAALAASENAAAAAEALVEYRRGMQDVVLPAEQHELSEAHNRWLQQALAVFHHRAFRDRDQQQQLKLMVRGSAPRALAGCSRPRRGADAVPVPAGGAAG